MVRRAEARLLWDALGRVSRPELPRSVALEDGLGLLPDQVELRTPVTILAGLNGVGKSRLLRLLEEALGGSARLISLHDLCGWIRQVVEKRPDLTDVTEEASPLDLDRDTEDAVRAIVRRDYDEILWYAPEFSESPFESIVGDTVAPYFLVSDGEARYGMDEMGLGELAAHVLLWVLYYLRDQGGVVLLLDEPDAFFPPSSRESLIDYLGVMAVRRNYTFVITTHSRELIDRGLTHDEVLSYIERGPEGIRFLTERPIVREIVRTSLYPENDLRVVGWVEDEAGLSLARALLEAIDRSLLARTKLYWVRGEGNLRGIRSKFIKPSVRRGELEFMFLADGDQEPEDPDPSRWPALTLPGGDSPDGLFKRHAMSNHERLADLLGLSVPVVTSIVQSNAGQDPHDLTEALLEASPLARQQGLHALAKATVETKEELVEEFRATLEASGIAAFSSLD